MAGIVSGLPRRLGMAAAAMILVVAVAGPAQAAADSDLPPGGSFVDDNGSVHEGSIEAIAAAGITFGCNPPANDRFCPEESVSRAEMASFLSRALGYSLLEDGPFTDIADSVHAPAINAISSAGITVGCNPPDNDRFCPDQRVTRAQMASFLVRAFDVDPAPSAGFVDTTDTVHAAAIDAIAAAGITLGCNPPDNDRYCPDSPISRAQMATFLTRAMGLDPIVPPDAPFHLVSSFTTHHNCCESRVSAVQSAARKIDGVVLLPGDEFSYLDILGNHVASGNCQTSTTLFNAVWYAGLDEVEHRPHSVNYARYPDGIESTLIPWAVDLRFRNDTAHPLEIRSHYTGTSVTVEIWGDNDGRTVVGDFTPANGTVIEIVNEGGPDARIVDTDTVRSGKTYTVTRTITVGEESTSETWSWTYAY